jgi:predicted RND superfamily exporter protein
MREFGLVSCGGVIITFFLTFLVAPFLFDKYLLGPTNSGELRETNKFLDSILNFILKTKKYFLYLFLISLVSSFFFINKLQFKTTSSIFFPKGSDIHDVHDELNKDFNSLLSMDILISPPLYPDLGFDFKWDMTSIPKSIYLVTKQISRIDKVQNVSSVGRVIEYFYDKGYTYSDWEKEGYVNELLNSKKHLVRIWFENADDVLSSYPKILFELNKYDQDFQFEVSSIVLLNNEIDLFLSRNIFTSLLTSGLLILLILYYLSLSLRVTLICLFVNLLPLSSIVLTFYFLGFHLNLITAMSSIICIGIIVDDTIHVVYRWKNNKNLDKLSYGMVTTSVILSLGFGMFAFSEFIPSRILGVTCGFTFVLALISDVAILPWLLNKFTNKDQNNVFK